jgi:hypothetical protein
MNNKIITVLVSMFLIMTSISCSNSKKDDFKQLDLITYGIPLKVKAPEGTIVKTEDMGIVKDITLKKGDDYFIQILSSSVIDDDIAKIKNDRLEEVKKSPYFSKVILDEDKGFIYEKKMNDSIFNYDFRYTKIQGNQQYTFQTGLFGMFTKEQVMKMYESIK